MSEPAARRASAGRAGSVALAGWTNVGKSTLFNRLVGEKVAAVADAPQTTRNRLMGVRTLPGKGQAVLVDTPGFHKPHHRMNRVMLEVARHALSGVDVALLVVDAERGLGPGDAEASKILAAVPASRLAVLNKIDRVEQKDRLLPMLRTVVEAWGFVEAIPVSALTGEGCSLLLDRILAYLPEGPYVFPEDFLTDQPERFLAAEFIREQVIRHTRQELPHATAVAVEQWHEREDGLVEIRASILVEREGQKAIVIGRGGAMLKQIGTEARVEIERVLGTRVFLQLWCRLRTDWRNDHRILRQLGLDG